MDTVYKLIYSTLAVHWRSYLMYSETNLFRELINFYCIIIYSDSMIIHFTVE